MVAPWPWPFLEGSEEPFPTAALAGRSLGRRCQLRRGRGCGRGSGCGWALAFPLDFVVAIIRVALVGVGILECKVGAGGAKAKRARLLCRGFLKQQQRKTGSFYLLSRRLGMSDVAPAGPLGHVFKWLKLERGKGKIKSSRDPTSL